MFLNYGLTDCWANFETFLIFFTDSEETTTLTYLGDVEDVDDHIK